LSPATFTGTELNVPPANASLFNPTATVDTDQWMAVAKSWGAGQVCLTARHSGGFAL
jgi:alpha-L-fucosidase